MLGAQAFLDGHDTEGWLFINFDGVGAPAALHYLRREGGPLRSWHCDPSMASICEEIARRRPELGLSATDRNSGLPYDTTPMLARGQQAITLSAQNGSIPNYHWPSDTPDALHWGTVRDAIATCEAFVRSRATC
jgi:hypothetical protein